MKTLADGGQSDLQSQSISVIILKMGALRSDSLRDVKCIQTMLFQCRKAPRGEHHENVALPAVHNDLFSVQ